MELSIREARGRPTIMVVRGGERGESRMARGCTLEHIKVHAIAAGHGSPALYLRQSAGNLLGRQQ